jgi:hypothetical protein
MIYKLRRFGHQLHQDHQGDEMQLVSETLEFTNHLMRLSASKNFMEFLGPHYDKI